MHAPLSLTIISSFQTARHNSRTLSMNPSGLHVAGADTPASNLSDPTCTDSDKYINKANHYKNMQTDDTDCGGYININKWKLLDINKKTDPRGRIHVNETNYDKDIRVFVATVDKEPETCKQYVLLPDSIYKEVLKSRAKIQIGDPLKVQINGDVWTGLINKNKFVKIFVKVE